MFQKKNNQHTLATVWLQVDLMGNTCYIVVVKCNKNVFTTQMS